LTLFDLVATRRAGLIWNRIRPVLTGGDATPDTVAALRAFAGPGNLALESAPRGFAVGADALALDLLGLAICLTLGVLRLAFLVLQALGFVAGRVALCDLLKPLFFPLGSDPLTLGVPCLLSGDALGFLGFQRSGAFSLFCLELARAFLLVTLGRFCLERFLAFSVFALLLAFALFLLALFLLGLERSLALGALGFQCSRALFLLALFFLGLERSLALRVLARRLRGLLLRRRALGCRTRRLLLSRLLGFAAGFFLAGLRASLRRLGAAFALARPFFGVAFFRTDIAESAEILCRG